MKFVLKTACLSLLCLFFVVNIHAQTEKEALQTFTPNETIQSVKITSDTDTSNVGIWQGTWSGDFILIYVKIRSKDMREVNKYKAKYEQEGNTAIITLSPKLPEIFQGGLKKSIGVEYEIFIPENLVIRN